MGGQFHDIAAGTATPKAYEYSWNDDVIAMNQFASVLTSATESIASALDTKVKGTPVVVYNPLSIAREDVVEARVRFLDAAACSFSGRTARCVRRSARATRSSSCARCRRWAGRCTT